MAKKLSNYKFSEKTSEILEELKNSYDKSKTEILENLVNFLYEEYQLAKQGKNYDVMLLAQVLGVREIK